MALKYSEDEVRHLVEQALMNRFGKLLEDRLWQRLKRSGAVQAMQAGHRTAEDLVQDIADIWRDVGMLPKILHRLQRQKSEQASEVLPPGRSPSSREDQRSVLLARQATEDEGVRRFRKRYLRRGLLARDRVQRWIERKAKSDGEPTRWLTVPLPTGVGVRRAKPQSWRLLSDPDCTIRATGGGNVHFRFLHYPDKLDGNSTRKLPTAREGALGRLEYLSVTLAERYGWQPVQATEFVLTGGIPLASSIRQTLRDSSINPRIILDIDPSTLPRQITTVYKAAQKALFGGRRPRSLTKGLQLTEFVLGRSPDESREDSMAQWNRKHRNERYDSLRRFERDVERAQQKLLAPFSAAEIWGSKSKDDGD